VNASPLPSNLDDWLSLLESRHHRAIDLGLERCGEVWQRMGYPRPAPKLFTVAGTNGKGSTVATLCGLLGGLGYRFGSYSTPHLHHYNERVQINGQAVSDDMLLQAFGQVEAARGNVSLSYFEFGTLAAFSILAGAGLNYAVMEVGLGGRLDAVNLLDADCSVITPIGLDHQEYLGDDLVSIGREKAGIIRPGRPVVCGDPNPPSSITEAAAVNEAPLKRLGVDFTVERCDDHARFRMGETARQLPLPALDGPHQLDNLATALAALFELIPAATISETALARGIRSVTLPGRLQRVQQRPAIWVDVGHNPGAAEAVAAALAEVLSAEGIRSCRCVLGMLADKDVAGVAQALEPVVSSWYGAGLEGDRGQSGDELCSRLKQTPVKARVRAYGKVDEAMKAAISDCGSAEGVLVFGSFLTAAQALAYAARIPPQVQGRQVI